MNLKQYLFTKDDAMVAFNLICTVAGIGTLGMPANFARAGPYLGLLAMIFMGATNIYASVAVSKVMLIAPKSVKTFGDLGEWCMGRFGRWAVVISQMLVCALIPTAFLVLGGILLDTLFPNAFSQTFWIIFMALMCLPVCLTPTLKEGAGAAFAGCMGTIVADVIGIAMLIHGMSGHPSVPKPDVSLEQVTTTFGNLALAYGAAVVIPSLQRQHKQPERMPQVVGMTIGFVTVLFIALAWAGYSAVGCQISGNLLFNVYPDATGRSSLGMKADYGAAVMAYLFMQLHITIAFSVVIYPVFYALERIILGMHAGPNVSIEEASGETLPYRASGTPKDSVKLSIAGNDVEQSEHDDSDDYKGAGAVVKYITLRIVIVVILVVVAIVLQDKFIDLSDFIGASTVTICAIILPIVFYQKKMGKQMPFYERVLGVVAMLLCAVLGCYVTYKTGKNLFAPDAGDGTKYPFCAAEHSMEFYYIKP